MNRVLRIIRIGCTIISKQGIFTIFFAELQSNEIAARLVRIVTHPRQSVEQETADSSASQMLLPHTAVDGGAA